ncbi:MAG: PilZ domain-containing protein [Candidatus Omnitrophota bacterium]
MFSAKPLQPWFYFAAYCPQDIPSDFDGGCSIPGGYLFNRYWGKDRRRFQRLLLNLTIWYKVRTPEHLRQAFGEEDMEATTLDLSTIGLAFISKHHIPVWSTLLLKFIFFGSPEDSPSIVKPVEVEAEVKACIPYENEFRLGVSFKGLDEERRVQLNRFIGATNRPYKEF